MLRYILSPSICVAALLATAPARAHFVWVAVVRHCATLIVQGTESGADAAGGTQTESPLTATDLLAHARRARAVWHDFPGFTAHAVITVDGTVSSGTLTVSSAGKVQLDISDPAARQWAERLLDQLADHRMPTGELGDKAKYDEQETQSEHPLGRKIHLLEDGMGSVYRVQGDVVRQVNRQQGKLRFTISVLDVARNGEGKYLPTSYTVSTWHAETGEVVSNQTHLQQYTRVRAFDLPVRLLEVHAGRNEYHVRSVELHDHKLLDTSSAAEAVQHKTAILLVSHGSHSPQWRGSLHELENDVRDEILADGGVHDVRSAFMEYTGPSIATRLKEFDREGFTDVVIVPLLLTVSSHSFDDIPTIAGLKHDHKTTETLRLEGIEIYKAKARVAVMPLLDFSDILEKNVIRRVKQLSRDPGAEGVVLVAYGDEQYNDEWTELLERIGAKLKVDMGVTSCRNAWCGHIARYKTEPTEAAIRQVLDEKQVAIVIPVLVAVDEAFQGRIIGQAVENVGGGDRVRYRRDAILPDANIRRWIVEVCQEPPPGTPR